MGIWTQHPPPKTANETKLNSKKCKTTIKTKHTYRREGGGREERRRERGGGEYELIQWFGDGVGLKSAI